MTGKPNSLARVIQFGSGLVRLRFPLPDVQLTPDPNHIPPPPAVTGTSPFGHYPISSGWSGKNSTALNPARLQPLPHSACWGSAKLSVLLTVDFQKLPDEAHTYSVSGVQLTASAVREMLRYDPPP